MEINLSWDLFVIVFFAVVIAYSFIVGRNNTLKIIISSYIAIMAADGISNLMERYLIGENPILGAFGFGIDQNMLIILKILIFVFTIVVITIKGRFSIDLGKTKSELMNMVLNLTYGVLSAGLITSTLLIYVSGASLVQETSIIMNETVLGMYRDSYMVQIMIDNYNVWFSVPAITFVLSSLATEEA